MARTPAKRKHPKANTAGGRKLTPSTKKQPSAKSSQKTQTQKIGFMDLPAELRNKIYDFAMEGEARVHLLRSPLKLQSRKKTDFEPEYRHLKENLLINCPLTQVSKQVRAEVLLMAISVASPRAKVFNFNFGHVITFFNKLSDEEVKKFMPVTGDAPSERAFTIDLSFSDAYVAEYPNEHTELGRWIRRMADPHKKGTRLNYRYTYGQGMRHRLRHFGEYGFRVWWDGTENEKSIEELFKIGEAVRKGFESC